MSYFYNKFYKFGQSRPQPPTQAPADFIEPRLPAAGLPNPPSTLGSELHALDTTRSVCEARRSLHERRWRTMKNDKEWYTYNDIPGRYAPSDYTGHAKRMLG